MIPTNLQLIERITELFKKRLGEKTNWGRNQIIDAYRDCVAKASLEALDELNNK